MLQSGPGSKVFYLETEPSSTMKRLFKQSTLSNPNKHSIFFALLLILYADVLLATCELRWLYISLLAMLPMHYRQKELNSEQKIPEIKEDNGTMQSKV